MTRAITGASRLRHTYGTRRAAAGISARNIQELMGHEDLETSAIYIHLIESSAPRGA